jgi:signal transduction histidine kinase
LDDANLHLQPDEARLFTRMVGALVSNAVNAGAGELSLRLHHDHDRISVTVIDDAGGFPDTPLPAGRGLERLVNDLGPGSLLIEPTANGSKVTLVMPRTDALTSSSNGAS